MWCLATSTTAPGCFMFGMQYDHQEDISKTQILKLIRAEILANFKMKKKKIPKKLFCVSLASVSNVSHRIYIYFIGLYYAIQRPTQIMIC